MACMWMLSARATPELQVIPNPAVERKKKQLRYAALGFMLVMAVAAGIMIYLEVDQRAAVVTVNVVNTQSGETRSYRVMKNEIDSEGFTTINGLQVFVAEIERIEIEAR